MKQLLVCLLCLCASGLAVAQGGKAEPNRVRFPAGRTSITLSGSLSNGQEMEYVFAANKGQRVTVKNRRTSLFDFKIYSHEVFSEGDFDSSASYTFEAPEDEDYILTVRKKLVRSPRKARYSITLIIK